MPRRGSAKPPAESVVKPYGCDWKAYALEPLPDMCDVMMSKNILNLQVVNCAAWNKNEDLFLGENQRGSGVRVNGTEIINGRTIDSITEGDKVTFIKMDIEGAELKALEGASNTIKKYHPKLAICIYHKPTDIYDIGSYLLTLYPNYKFYIRQYTTSMWETVLYAIDRGVT